MKRVSEMVLERHMRVCDTFFFIVINSEVQPTEANVLCEPLLITVHSKVMYKFFMREKFSSLVYIQYII